MTAHVPASLDEWFFPRGRAPRDTGDQWESVIDRGRPGWQHAGLRVGTLLETATLALPAGATERMVVPLEGDVTVQWQRGDDRGTVHLAGRESPFDGPADVAYLGDSTAVVLTGSGRVAVADAVSDAHLPVAVMRGDDIPVEIRGAGRSTRQVHNFGVPGALAAQNLIVCEVITPAENWSSYPAHKHDVEVPGRETSLEEIYYFESAVTRGASAPPDADPFGMFATYSSPAGQISINALVRTGDIALVPFGYHGPAVAAPGYDLYYLNVMAGAGPERSWLITDDPAHSWIRSSWSDQSPDERLPYRASRKAPLV